MILHDPGCVELPVPLQIGKMRLRRSGSDIALIGYGNPVNDCLAAAELLQQVWPWPAETRLPERCSVLSLNLACYLAAGRSIGNCS